MGLDCASLLSLIAQVPTEGPYRRPHVSFVNEEQASPPCRLRQRTVLDIQSKKPPGVAGHWIRAARSGQCLGQTIPDTRHPYLFHTGGIRAPFRQDGTDLSVFP